MGTRGLGEKHIRGIQEHFIFFTLRCPPETIAQTIDRIRKGIFSSREHHINGAVNAAQVVEKERGRDVAVEEIAALKDATEAAATGAEERRKRLQTAEEERRRLSGELERLELELRKLRKRDEVGARGQEGRAQIF